MSGLEPDDDLVIRGSDDFLADQGIAQLGAIRDQCSSARLVSVEGLSNPVDPITR